MHQSRPPSIQGCKATLRLGKGDITLDPCLREAHLLLHGRHAFGHMRHPLDPLHELLAFRRIALRAHGVAKQRLVEADAHVLADAVLPQEAKQLTEKRRRQGNVWPRRLGRDHLHGGNDREDREVLRAAEALVVERMHGFAKLRQCGQELLPSIDAFASKHSAFVNPIIGELRSICLLAGKRALELG